jgi:hypothetical protein
MSCKGYSDGEDFDCEYEFAGDFGCEDCMWGPHPDQFSMDPETGKRVSLKKWEKFILHAPKDNKDELIADELIPGFFLD